MVICIFLCICPFYELLSVTKKDCLHSFTNRTEASQIEGIDEIYLINLDRRKRKYSFIKKHLEEFQINPLRFSAIDGLLLQKEEINVVGTFIENDSTFLFNIDMFKNNYLRESDIGKFLHICRAGQVGCYLSHLSIMEHALSNSYETVLVLEDDITFLEDPYNLTKYIKQLDQTVGYDNWDILYLDDDKYYDPQKKRSIHRPDEIQLCCQYLARKKNLDGAEIKKRQTFQNAIINRILLFDAYEDSLANFRRIISRPGTYAMIIRKKGLEKILNFYYNHGIFYPIDLEMRFIFDLNLFNLKKKIVSVDKKISDTN